MVPTNRLSQCAISLDLEVEISVDSRGGGVSLRSSPPTEVALGDLNFKISVDSASEESAGGHHLPFRPFVSPKYVSNLEGPLANAPHALPPSLFGNKPSLSRYGAFIFLFSKFLNL
ncbi:hypothetical protein CDL15_Pgr013332 [Punica granatum]|uniref:Uncharacterized protein n=1 Tax=Punica granatum TaxID=22663 RepID=A0A218WPM4_PUNGR|nr:hypothetical protein CDL15_Pgr013332 [Punica granatum]PKI73696.1 hypothetical protein CRG98_005937 [Punica granatum]